MTYQEFLKALKKTTKDTRWRLTTIGLSMRIRSGNRCPIERVAQMPYGSVWDAARKITLPSNLTRRIIHTSDGNRVKGISTKAFEDMRRDLLKACGLKERRKP